MDCHEFRRHLDEFADGTPGVADEPTRISHVDSCPDCRALVEDLLAVGAALRQTLGTRTAPDRVRARVRRALACEAEHVGTAQHAEIGVGDGALVASALVGPETQRSTTRRYRLILVPLAVAALLALAVGAWQVLSPRPGARTTVVHVQNTVLAAARARHRWCSREEHVFHRDSDLPDNLPEIGAVLGDELGLDVRAPSLVDQGFSFVGARRCKVAGIPVAHLLYFAPRQAVMLSLFSMYRVHDLGEAPSDAKTHLYFALSESREATLAWNEGRQTYVLCASLGENELLPIGESLRGSSEVAGLARHTSALASALPSNPGIAARPPGLSSETK